MADFSREEILRNAQAAAQVVGDDYSLQDLVDDGIRGKEAKMQRRRAEQEQNYRRRAERARNFDQAAAGLDPIIKEFDVEDIQSNIEYGKDQSEFILKTADDKDFKGKVDRRKDTYLQDLVFEDEARQGIFGIDVEEPPLDKEIYRPRRNNQPELDDYVIKSKGVPVGFVKDKDGLYRKPSRDPDAKIKAAMAKRRGAGSRNVYDMKANNGRGGFVDKDYKGDLYYREDVNNGPNAGFGPGQNPPTSGRGNDLDIYNKLTTAIQTGQIQEPEQLAQAEKIRQDIRRRIDPQYDKTIEFDEGVNTVRANTGTLPSQEIRRRADLQLRKEFEGNGTRGESFPINAYAEREQAILQSLSRPAAPLVGGPVEGETPVGSFLPSNANFKGMGNEEIRLSGYVGGKKDYTRTVPRMLSEEIENMPYAQYVLRDTGEGGLKGVYLDADGGNPLSLQNVQLSPAVNAPNTNQTLNAPARSSLMDVMQDNWYNSRSSGTYPQTDISGELNLFAERLKGLKGLTPDGNLNVRSVEEAEALLDQVISKGKANNVKFTEFGSKKVVNDPGALNALAKMRYSSPELTAFSNALTQLGLANKTNVNLDRKDSFQSRTGDYMPQGIAGNPVVNLSGPAGSVTPGREYIEFARPDAMSDYQVGENVAYANSRNAPQFRKLEGTTLNDLSTSDRASVLDDAKRPYIGAIKGESVGIAGVYGNPNYRFNATGITSPADIAIHLQAQAQRRADANGKPVDEQRLRTNIGNAVAVARRQEQALSAPGVIADQSGIRDRQKRIEIMEHIKRPVNTPRPHYRPSDKQLENKFYDRTRSQQELLGIDSMGIEAAASAKKPEAPNYSVVESPINIQVPEGFIPKSERQGRIGKIKSGLGEAFKKYGQGSEYTVPRRVGYGAAGAVGLAGLAGLLSNESDRRKQEQYQ